MVIRRIRLAAALLLGGAVSFMSSPLLAGVVIENTRVIYPAQDREVAVKLSNDEKTTPLLIQAWIDEGNTEHAPDQLKVPFLLTPPVFRLDPGKGQALRIIYLKDKPLPADKESVFWLNVQEVPPTSKAAKGEERNLLQLAYRTRIKLFFRPKGLKSAVNDAPEQLRWKQITEGSEHLLQAENPTPYYISFESVALVVDGKEIQSEGAAQMMVAPGATQRFPLKDVPAGAKLGVRFTNIDDYGQYVLHTASLTP
jgi:P pilus assembly chaperone PapD